MLSSDVDLLSQSHSESPQFVGSDLTDRQVPTLLPRAALVVLQFLFYVTPPMVSALSPSCTVLSLQSASTLSPPPSSVCFCLSVCQIHLSLQLLSVWRERKSKQEVSSYCSVCLMVGTP